MVILYDAHLLPFAQMLNIVQFLWIKGVVLRDQAKQNAILIDRVLSSCPSRSVFVTIFVDIFTLKYLKRGLGDMA
jgi:hypothetical protein